MWPFPHPTTALFKLKNQSVLKCWELPHLSQIMHSLTQWPRWAQFRQLSLWNLISRSHLENVSRLSLLGVFPGVCALYLPPPVTGSASISSAPILKATALPIFSWAAPSENTSFTERTTVVTRASPKKDKDSTRLFTEIINFFVSSH